MSRMREPVPPDRRPFSPWLDREPPAGRHARTSGPVRADVNGTTATLGWAAGPPRILHRPGSSAAAVLTCAHSRGTSRGGQSALLRIRAVAPQFVGSGGDPLHLNFAGPKAKACRDTAHMRILARRSAAARPARCSPRPVVVVPQKVVPSELERLFAPNSPVGHHSGVELPEASPSSCQDRQPTMDPASR